MTKYRDPEKLWRSRWIPHIPQRVIDWIESEWPIRMMWCWAGISWGMFIQALVS